MALSLDRLREGVECPVLLLSVEGASDRILSWRPGMLPQQDLTGTLDPGAGVRISPHFYTSDEELELVINEMKKIRGTRAYEGNEKAGAAF